MNNKTIGFILYKVGSKKPPKPENLSLKGDTIIGNDVWIGQNVTFLPKVKIGDGTIIGANSEIKNLVSSN